MAGPAPLRLDAVTTATDDREVMVVETSKPVSKTILHRAESYSWRLVLITAGSSLGIVVPGLFGAGPIEALLGSILVGLLSAFFAGERPVTRAKALAALALTLIAVILTVSGFMLADLVRGRSVLGNRRYTFATPSLSVVKIHIPSSGWRTTTAMGHSLYQVGQKSDRARSSTA